MLSHTRLLRESARITERSVDLHAVADSTVDSGLAGGAALVAFTDAAVTGSGGLAIARTRLRNELGAEALVDAAGVVGTFEMMNRVADATGFTEGTQSRIEDAELIADLGFDRFDHAN